MSITSTVPEVLAQRFVRAVAAPRQPALGDQHVHLGQRNCCSSNAFWSSRIASLVTGVSVYIPSNEVSAVDVRTFGSWSSHALTGHMSRPSYGQQWLAHSRWSLRRYFNPHRGVTVDWIGKSDRWLERREQGAVCGLTMCCPTDSF